MYIYLEDFDIRTNKTNITNETDFDTSIKTLI